MSLQKAGLYEDYIKQTIEAIVGPIQIAMDNVEIPVEKPMSILGVQCDDMPMFGAAPARTATDNEKEDTMDTKTIIWNELRKHGYFDHSSNDQLHSADLREFTDLLEQADTVWQFNDFIEQVKEMPYPIPTRPHACSSELEKIDGFLNTLITIQREEEHDAHTSSTCQLLTEEEYHGRMARILSVIRIFCKQLKGDSK